MLSTENDPLGQAISNFFFHNDKSPIHVKTNITYSEEISVSHFFRKFESMPNLEQIALKMVTGNILDVGAGAGAHSFELQNNGFDVTAIDLSIPSCNVMRRRGIKNVLCEDIWTFESSKFDTILFMMNGIGVAKTLDGLEPLLNRLKNIIKTNGQVILDSSDIKYMFEDDCDSLWVDLEKSYYGDLDYFLSYKKLIADPFPWLFVGFEILEEVAIKSGWKVEHIFQDDHHHYLARLTLNS